MAASSIVDTIRRYAIANHVDPAAVLAVARQEGLSGGIGDSGTSFGPFQLHIGGALPSSVGARGAQYAQQWATSPAGIADALSRIGQVAGGQKGAQAVASIVRKFERPADPNSEIAGALKVLGLPVSAAGIVSSPPGVAGVPAPQGISPLLQQAYNSNNDLLGVPSIDLSALFAGTPAAPAATSDATAPAGSASGGQIAELLREGTGGPTHSTGPHLHFASTTAAAMLAALAEGKRLGLTELENPYVDPVNFAVHAPHSYHKLTFPGVYGGRKLGEATDFSGDPAVVNALYKYIESHFGA